MQRSTAPTGRFRSSWQRLGICLLASVIATLTLTACTGGTDTAEPDNHCDAVELDGRIPPDTQAAAGVETVDETTGLTSVLYPKDDTSLDTWYGSNDCEWSVGGDVPDAASNPNIDGALNDSGIKETAADLEGQLSVEDLALSSSEGLTTPADGTAIPCGKNVYSPPVPDRPAPLAVAPGPVDCYKKVTPRPLDPTKPFGGRDIIFVHGLKTAPIFASAKGALDASTVAWPQHPGEFYNPTGYWKSTADASWDAHITKYLKGGNPNAVPSNRYLTIAWPSTQHLIYGANAMLSQIADAMNYPSTGVQTGLANPTPADRAGFCAGGCVIISHSTGALLTDAAMALANETKTNLALRTTLGNIGYIPDHMRAHIAQHGAFSGSNYATAMVGAALPLANPATCTLALLIANNVFGGSFTSCGGSVFAFPQSVLFDLIPQVTQTVWGPWINKTPVVTLTTSGGHPTSVGVEASWAGAKALTFLKPLLHRGFDDGVTAGNGACANPNPESDWPSGFVAKSSPLDVAPNAAAALVGLVTPVVRKVYDMGNPLRGIPFYIDQVIDRRYAPGGPTRTTPYFVAGECTPYVAPDGMVQPVNQLKTSAMWGSSPTNPLARYNNHYSYLMSTSDHYYGPRGPYPSTCYERTSVASLASTCLGSNQDNTEEVRVITDNFVYTSGLVNPAMKNMVVESVKGKRLPKLCKHCKKRWIWKRVYHKLVGSDTLVEDDYVYNYVLR